LLGALDMQLPPSVGSRFARSAGTIWRCVER
jgi:hypothetical protein